MGLRLEDDGCCIDGEGEVGNGIRAGAYVFSEHGISMSAEHQWPGAQRVQLVARSSLA